jgi:hypothetical protein
MFITMTMPHTTFRPWRRWRPWLSVVPLCVSIHAVAPRRESAWIREVCIAWMIPDVCEFLWQMMYCLALLCYLCLDLCATVEDDFVDVFLHSHQPFINSLQCPNISSGRFPNFKQGWKHQFTNWGISIPENPESRRYQIYWALTTCIGALDAMNPCSCYWRLGSSWVFHVFFRVSGDELVKDKYFLAISSRPPPGTFEDKWDMLKWTSSSFIQHAVSFGTDQDESGEAGKQTLEFTLLQYVYHAGQPCGLVWKWGIPQDPIGLS